MSPPELNNVLKRLQEWHAEVLRDLTTADRAASVELTQEIKHAIGCIQMCQRYAISHYEAAVTKDDEFVIEDHETDLQTPGRKSLSTESQCVRFSEPLFSNPGRVQRPPIV